MSALTAAGTYRRTGVGTALMTAVERWGSAALVALDTNLRSAPSVPFYEDRLGYAGPG